MDIVQRLFLSGGLSILFPGPPPLPAAGVPEAFVKVTGPRPNVFLWVQISRFTPSGLEVWIEQTATGIVRYYRLGSVGPGDPDVSGRQDRRSFPP